MSESSSTRHVVIFCGRYHGASMVEHIEAVADAFPLWRLVIAQEFPRRALKSYVRGKIRRLRREPISYPLEIAGQIARKFRRPRKRSVTGGTKLPADLEDIDRPNVEYRRCGGLHDAETLEFVRSLNPWIGLAIGAPILRRSLFEIPQRGTINLHKSLLPDYRGMPPGFWELHDGAPVTGATVHWVDEGLDTGEIITQVELEIPPYATVAGLGAELDRLGTEVLLRALRQIDAGVDQRVPQQASPVPGRTRPANRVARKLRRRLLRNRRPARTLAGTIRQIAKTIVLGAYVYAWAPVRNVFRAMRGSAHATVLLYHRVSDAFRDSITVGVEQFGRHLAILARHYDVIDLPTFLADRHKPRRRPCVVITFDDGYEDNLLAAMLLRRAGLPATIFLSTDILTRRSAFPHDLKAFNRGVPTLSWDQVRTLSRWGIAFGNHTADHVDLAAEPLATAVAQIESAEKDLTRELNGANRLRCLAYPYGMPEHLTPAVRRALPGVGIEHCLSAYGGVNRPDFDPLNILRQGVDCGFGDLAFRAAVEGWRFRSR